MISAKEAEKLCIEKMLNRIPKEDLTIYEKLENDYLDEANNVIISTVKDGNRWIELPILEDFIDCGGYKFMNTPINLIINILFL